MHDHKTGLVAHFLALHTGRDAARAGPEEGIAAGVALDFGPQVLLVGFLLRALLLHDVGVFDGFLQGGGEGQAVLPVGGGGRVEEEGREVLGYVVVEVWAGVEDCHRGVGIFVEV